MVHQNKKINIYFILCIVGFLILSLLYRVSYIEHTEIHILQSISKIRNHILTSFMIWLAYISSWDFHIWIIGIVGGYFFIKKRYSFIQHIATIQCLHSLQKMRCCRNA